MGVFAEKVGNSDKFADIIVSIRPEKRGFYELKRVATRNKVSKGDKYEQNKTLPDRTKFLFFHSAADTNVGSAVKQSQPGGGKRKHAVF